MKLCLRCKKNVKAKAFECPYCGSRNFGQNVVHTEQPIALSENNIKIDLYSEKLMSLIDLALSDGELTEKEKQILFKKAEAEGIDLDEFEMVLDSKLKILQTPKKSESIAPNREINTGAYTQLEQLIDLSLKDGVLSEFEKETIMSKGISLGISKNEIDIILNSKLEEKKKILAQTSAPKSDKFGDIKKCPSCGAIAQSFSIKCTDCGYDFNNIEANASIQKLFKMLNEAESMRNVENKSNNPLAAIGSFYSNAFNNMQGPDSIAKRKMEIISNFPIPNTKEDILEFLSLAIPKAKKAGNFLTQGNPDNKAHNDFVLVWKTKCEQIIMKARFSMKEDKKTLDEVESYAQILGIK